MVRFILAWLLSSPAFAGPGVQVVQAVIPSFEFSSSHRPPLDGPLGGKEFGGYRVFSTYHPSASLRNQSGVFGLHYSLNNLKKAQLITGIDVKTTGSAEPKILVNRVSSGDEFGLSVALKEIRRVTPAEDHRFDRKILESEWGDGFSGKLNDVYLASPEARRSGRNKLSPTELETIGLSESQVFTPAFWIKLKNEALVGFRTSPTNVVLAYIGSGISSGYALPAVVFPNVKVEEATEPGELAMEARLDFSPTDRFVAQLGRAGTNRPLLLRLKLSPHGESEIALERELASSRARVSVANDPAGCRTLVAVRSQTTLLEP